MTRYSRTPRDRGQIALPMLAVVLAVAVVAAAALLVMGRLLVDRSAAQTAADAAALAGAAEGRAAAAAIAESNGADLASFDHEGASVQVTVIRGWASASARAGPAEGP